MARPGMSWPDGMSIVDLGYVTATATTAGTGALEDITSATVDVVIPAGATGSVIGVMTFQTTTTTGGAKTGGWVVDIGGTDGPQLDRYLSGTNDTGVGAVQFMRTGLSAGTYTVKGEHLTSVGSITTEAIIIAYAFVGV